MNRLNKLLLAATLLAGLLHIAEAAEKSKAFQTQSTGTFHVKVSQGELSLEASQAPLVQILDEIGKQARIRIETNIGPEETITTSLNRVPIEHGIKQLARNVTVFYAQAPNDKPRRIERIVVLSQHKEGSSGQPAASSETGKRGERAPEPAVKKPSPQREPFKFEFDPTKPGEKLNPRKQP